MIVLHGNTVTIYVQTMAFTERIMPIHSRQALSFQCPWHVTPTTRMASNQFPNSPMYVAKLLTCKYIMKKYVSKGSEQVAEHSTDSESSCRLSI